MYTIMKRHAVDSDATEDHVSSEQSCDPAYAHIRVKSCHFSSLI